ncbi:hypothetical protein [Lactobacillus kullabergensis]
MISSAQKASETKESPQKRTKLISDYRQKSMTKALAIKLFAY